ncbi:prephenate dehydrogenase/arogenate dehydrogenase family protein [Saccharicrinis aurantiacus]|uniref:prephenate dehydrogenase/arogenate dehydrogenase family protein n=1 Tax=Saccharicrinis aurantiacus TaxID=1849719 RepID=UPI00094FF47A|nr:prephenate dehydrogenase/arogenate dehydrogenase family protein [Saccharicrinis aurantiacus]
MKICILGAGKMGTWLSDALCLDHEVALYDPNLEKLKYVFNTQRLTKLEEITEFAPQILVNAVTLKYTIQAFDEVIPYLPKTCIISDISSVKTGFKEYYEASGMPYVSTHPMFGPTFGNLKSLGDHHSIIISEGDHLGKTFFKDFYSSLGLNIHEYSFVEHDETIAYSLSIPFSSTLVFASVMKKQEAPGTTFKKHFDIAKGLLSEDDYLLSEILFNPFTSGQVEQIRLKLKELLAIIETKDTKKMQEFLAEVRENIE